MSRRIQLSEEGAPKKALNAMLVHTDVWVRGDAVLEFLQRCHDAGASLGATIEGYEGWLKDESRRTSSSSGLQDGSAPK